MGSLFVHKVSDEVIILKKSPEDYFYNINKFEKRKELIVNKNNYKRLLADFEFPTEILKKFELGFYSRGIKFQTNETQFNQNKIKNSKARINIIKYGQNEIKINIHYFCLEGYINHYKKHKRVIKYSDGSEKICYENIYSKINNREMFKIKNYFEKKLLK